MHLDLVRFLLGDYTLICTSAVEAELGKENPTNLKLKTLIAQGGIHRQSPRTEKVKLYGHGERAALNLALEKRLLLLIDDWRPYEMARAFGIETVNTVTYLASLLARALLPEDQVLQALGTLVRRGTIRAEWISAGLAMVAEIRQRRRKEKLP
ncbi:MAG: hypothetical protein ACE5JN_16480 [Candidatus Methylomirabilia bacterium]